MRKKILVIGTASLDTLRLMMLQPPQTVHAIGGAGLYTALAAAKAGAEVTLLAPKPHPAPPEFAPAQHRLVWLGPECAPDQLPKLDIAHFGNGKAELKSASWGAEALLTTAVLATLAISEFDWVHIAALSSAQRQLDFVLACKAHAAKRISVGTYSRLAYHETDTVKKIMLLADVFFMNENEAGGVFGSVDAACAREDQLLFITLGERGALVLGEHAQARTQVPSVRVNEIDPTGAGDTFCGTVLAGLCAGLAAPQAALRGTQAAASEIQQFGPLALYEP